MAITVDIINTASLLSDGVELLAKHGPSTTAKDQSYGYSVLGQGNVLQGTVATATVTPIWSSAAYTPTAFKYLHFVADQIVYLQFITAGTNVTFKCTPHVPLVLPLNSMLAAANTTPIAGGAEPATVAIATIDCGNYSGSTANYRLFLAN